MHTVRLSSVVFCVRYISTDDQPESVTKGRGCKGYGLPLDPHPLTYSMITACVRTQVVSILSVVTG